MDRTMAKTRVLYMTVKRLLKVIPLFCIAHPYCARFLAPLARAHKQNGGFFLCNLVRVDVKVNNVPKPTSWTSSTLINLKRQRLIKSASLSSPYFLNYYSLCT